MLTRILPYARELIQSALSKGDVAVDGTVGSGRDTLFLARCVGAEGRVYGFDVQAGALEVARARLREAGALGQVRLFLAGHEQMEALVGHEAGKVRAVMFNLGYLPRSDRSVVTRPETTLQALEAAYGLLAPDGMITVVVYMGHAGGQEECEQILAWAKRLTSMEAKVLWYQFVNARTPPPSLIAIHKR